MFNVNKPVQTRNGRYKGRILCIDRKGSEFQIVALLTDDKTEMEQCYVFLANGQMFNGQSSPMDLVNVPDVKKIYRLAFSEGRVSARRYMSTETAKADVQHNHFDTAEIAWEGYTETIIMDGKISEINFIKKDA